MIWNNGFLNHSFDEVTFTFLSLLPGNVYWKNLNGFYCGVNKAFIENYGYDSPEDVIGKTDQELWPSCAEELNKNDQKVLDSERTMRFEEVIYTATLGEKHFIAIKSPLRDKDNKIVGIIANSIDITEVHEKHLFLIKEKENAEKKDKLSTHLLQDIVSSVPGNLYWKNTEGIWLGCNEYTAKTLGFTSKEDVIGKTDQELWADQADFVRLNDQQVINSGKALHIEETVILPTGENRSYAVVKVPFKDENNNIIGIIGNSLDITELKKAQAEVIEAKEKAEVHLLKTEFIENMQHDLRTPAAGIYQLLEMLSTMKDPDELMELIPFAAKASKELLDLCNEVIDFENAEYGRHTVAYQTIDIKNVSERIITLNSAAARHKNIHLQLDINENVPQFVQGDEYRVRKILTNLIGNSLKFTEVGEVKLTVSLLRTEVDKVWIEFDVSDTGIGIPEDKYNLIFEKFIRLNPSNKGTYKGTGLGLSSVKKYVSELDGKIEVKSQVNVGSHFRVILPFILKNIGIHPSDAGPIDNINPISDTAKKLGHGNTKILLIEDDLLARFVAKKLIQALGYHLAIAGDVSQAKTILDVEQFDLVISDFGLPDGTGFDIIKHIKQAKQSINHTTSFVLLTAHSNEEKRVEAKANHFLDVFEKPLTEEMIKWMVNKYIFSEQK